MCLPEYYNTSKRSALATVQPHTAETTSKYSRDPRPQPSTPVVASTAYLRTQRQCKHSRGVSTSQPRFTRATVLQRIYITRGRQLAPSAWRRYLNVPCPNRGFVGSGGQLRAQAAVFILRCDEKCMYTRRDERQVSPFR